MFHSIHPVGGTVILLLFCHWSKWCQSQLLWEFEVPRIMENHLESYQSLSVFTSKSHRMIQTTIIKSGNLEDRVILFSFHGPCSKAISMYPCVFFAFWIHQYSLGGFKSEHWSHSAAINATRSCHQILAKTPGSGCPHANKHAGSSFAEHLAQGPVCLREVDIFQKECVFFDT